MTNLMYNKKKMDVLNQHFIVVDENAGVLGLGARVRSEVDGVIIAEKVVYGDR